jgi:hypothetical protein
VLVDDEVPVPVLLPSEVEVIVTKMVLEGPPGVFGVMTDVFTIVVCAG